MMQRTILTPISSPRHEADHRPAWVRSLDDAGPIDVSVCIANWNCMDELRACLTSLQDHPQGVRLETIVVDNASADGAVAMVAREFPEVILIRNNSNAGFARASNQAAAVARGRYLFFLNNDTVVPAYSLRKLVDYADAHPDVGMVGPRLRDSAGRLQISFRRTPDLAAMLHRTSLLNWTRLFKSRYEEYRRNHFDPDAQRDVEVLMGAAVLLPRDLFTRAGKWDEDFRFGVEDIELSVRVGRTHRLVYLPQVEIVHRGRLSSRSNVAFAAPNLLIGYVHYFRKTGVSRRALLGYKLVLTIDAPLGIVVKAGQVAVRRLLGRHAQAERSLTALSGLWHFLTRHLVRFWRA